ncbi:hypothetical protein [Flavivirga spongiicola]|uniref:Uncharacterized protein n=1 Tax=Flavivirga spongiicola TaxID=421621 RepID=A0ABU7XNJ1_9FLAO|nr:hypothetical protein [Flavivirga sp. MEBiC05379]MDO5977337.1 hypothetical protein [Flavivirga sp. MEBiC05379]
MGILPILKRVTELFQNWLLLDISNRPFLVDSHTKIFGAPCHVVVFALNYVLVQWGVLNILYRGKLFLCV